METQDILTISGLGLALLIAIVDWGALRARLFSWPKALRFEKGGLNGRAITRLIWRGCGLYPTRSIEVQVVSIKEGSKNRPDFLPVPLRWTHYNSPTRMLLPKQHAYLDICEGDPFSVAQVLCSAISFGMNASMYRLTDIVTQIELMWFSENGKTGKLTLYLKWNSNGADFSLTQ
jgi:hypothetical protein